MRAMVGSRVMQRWDFVGWIAACDSMKILKPRLSLGFLRSHCSFFMLMQKKRHYYDLIKCFIT